VMDLEGLSGLTGLSSSRDDLPYHLSTRSKGLALLISVNLQSAFQDFIKGSEFALNSVAGGEGGIFLSKCIGIRTYMIYIYIFHRLV
jgi:hypothetical protein